MHVEINNNQTFRINVVEFTVGPDNKVITMNTILAGDSMEFIYDRLVKCVDGKLYVLQEVLNDYHEAMILLPKLGNGMPGFVEDVISKQRIIVEKYKASRQTTFNFMDKESIERLGDNIQCTKMTKADAYFYKTLKRLMNMESVTFGTAYADYLLSLEKDIATAKPYNEFELDLLYEGLVTRTIKLPEKYFGELTETEVAEFSKSEKELRFSQLYYAMIRKITESYKDSITPISDAVVKNIHISKIYFALKHMLKDNYIARDVRPKYADGKPSHTTYFNNAIFEYDLAAGELPLISYRNQSWKSAIKEVLWIYQDQSNDLSLLKDKHNIHWWDSWESKDIPGTIGQRYGATIKKYDMVNKLIKSLKENPMDRRQIMDMLQFSDLQETDGLFPCAYSTTWNVRGDYLDMILNQRSCDFLVAWSINQFQYAALQIMIAKACGLKPGNFTHVVGNIHIYDRHFAAAKELLSRKPDESNAPKLIFDPVEEDFYTFGLRDFKLIDYIPDEKQLKFELAI